jgi:DNA-binding NtrC family response regulator
MAKERGEDGLRPELTPIGDSPALRAVLELVDRVADTPATVLISGETGTGKELVARRLHERGARRAEPFVAVNVSAVPEALLESELFGHVRGAFTDARTARTGLFLEAGRGTLFLDEIGEMPVGLQAKLLRALQERRVRAVGADREVPFEARVVAASHRELLTEVEAHRFRADLYFRLAVIEIEVPPLRARPEDISPLALHFLEEANARYGRELIGFEPDVLDVLARYRWPGNVRELANCVERAVATASGPEVRLEDLPQRVQAAGPERAGAPESEQVLLPLDVVERRHVERVLRAVGGHRGRAAAVLGLDRKTLYRKLERWSAQSDRDDA